MTNEDIIKTLRQLEYPYPTCDEQEKVNEALDIAIKAIEFFEKVIAISDSTDFPEYKEDDIAELVEKWRTNTPKV